MNYLLRLMFNSMFIAGLILGFVAAGTMDYHLEAYGNSGPWDLLWLELGAVALMIPRMVVSIKENLEGER